MEKRSRNTLIIIIIIKTKILTCMHSAVLIWFRLGVMIDTIVVYILIPV